jgi:uncharacterized membrane protein YeiH
MVLRSTKLWPFVAMFFLRSRHFEPTERAMQWPAAVGLGLFKASGAQVAFAQGMPAIVAVLTGKIRGCLRSERIGAPKSIPE